MKRTIITAGAALLAVVPATVGLTGNASFAQSVAVRAPSHVAAVDDKGGPARHVEPGDDRGGKRTTTHTTPQPKARDDKGGRTRHTEPGDDKGRHGRHGGDDGPLHV